MASENSLYDIGIVRQFPFSSTLQRASVIVKPYQSGPKVLSVYLKGAPETVAKLCQPSTLPSDFYEVLKVPFSMNVFLNFSLIPSAYFLS